MAKQTSFYDVFLPIVKSYDYFQIDREGKGYSSVDVNGKERIPKLYDNSANFEFLDDIPDNEKQEVAKDLADYIYRYDKANRIKQHRDQTVEALNDIDSAIKKDLKIVQNFKQLVEDATYNFYVTGEYKETGKGEILSFVEEMERELSKKDFGGLIQKGRYYKDVPITHSTKEELKTDLQKLFSKYKLKDKQGNINRLAFLI
jgi:hypothetical protein